MRLPQKRKSFTTEDTEKHRGNPKYEDAVLNRRPFLSAKLFHVIGGAALE
jgi:hypothetical protein